LSYINLFYIRIYFKINTVENLEERRKYIHMIEIDTNPYKSIVIVDDEGELLTVSEGDNIEFAIESTGEVKQGFVTKLNGKNEKLKIQMVPKDQNYEEIWPVVVISEGSLKLVEKTNETEDED